MPSLFRAMKHPGALIKELTKRPPKEKQLPTVQNFVPNARHQADSLKLPKDGKFQYALVVVDTTTKKMDAEPMTTASSKEALRAIQQIYKRPILNKPSVAIETDRGVEFQGVFRKWLEQNNLVHKQARTNRHQQVTLAERRNYSVSRQTGLKQLEREFKSGVTNKAWVNDLRGIVDEVNKKKRQSVPSIKQAMKAKVKCEGNSCRLLERGTKVRVKLDFPVDPVTGKKLHGKFRASDIRWDPKIRTIKKRILKPGQPPLYRVSGDGTKGTGPNKNRDKETLDALYTKGQLQLVKEDNKKKEESQPREDKASRADDEDEEEEEKWIIDRILKKKRKRNGQVIYVIKWANTRYNTKAEATKAPGAKQSIKAVKVKGGTKYEVQWKPTDEPASQIKKDVPAMVKEFEKAKK